jgi:hypothetical protein
MELNSSSLAPGESYPHPSIARRIHALIEVRPLPFCSPHRPQDLQALQEGAWQPGRWVGRRYLKEAEQRCATMSPCSPAKNSHAIPGAFRPKSPDLIGNRLAGLFFTVSREAFLRWSYRRNDLTSTPYVDRRFTRVGGVPIWRLCRTPLENRQGVRQSLRAPRDG